MPKESQVSRARVCTLFFSKTVNLTPLNFTDCILLDLRAQGVRTLDSDVRDVIDFRVPKFFPVPFPVFIYRLCYHSEKWKIPWNSLVPVPNSLEFSRPGNIYSSIARCSGSPCSQNQKVFILSFEKLKSTLPTAILMKMGWIKNVRRSCKFDLTFVSIHVVWIFARSVILQTASPNTSMGGGGMFIIDLFKVKSGMKK